MLLAFFAPEHWLQGDSSAGVTVDGRPIRSSIYIGHAAANEAQAFLLVRVPGEGSFLFNSLGGTYRELRENEFLRLFGGAVIKKRMTDGPWVETLPPLKINEFRVHSLQGHTIDVRF